MMKQRMNTIFNPATVAGLAVGALLMAAPGVMRAEPDAAKSAVIECRGSVEPRQEWNLRLRPGERVLAVHVAEGEWVKAGEPLVEVNDAEGWTRLAELQTQERARFELKSKAARLDDLERELDTQLQLWKTIEPDSAERRVTVLREKRDELKEQVEILKLQVADPAATNAAETSLDSVIAAQIAELKTQLASPVAAPFDGQVAYGASHPTRLVAGETVLKVWGTNVLVRAQILQHQLANVAKGCRAEVSLDFSDQKQAPATINRVEIQPTLQPGEAYPTFGVELYLDKPCDWLKAGMRVSVRIHPLAAKNNSGRP